MPRPPAAFSPLTTTKSSSSSSRSPGSSAASVRRPIPPTTSPTKSNLIRCAYCRSGDDGCVSPDAPPPENALTEEVPRAPDPVVVPRWIQLVILPLVLLGVWALARASGPVLLVFAVASVIALILNPVVEAIEKPLRRAHIPRGLAVAIVYLALVVAVLGVGVAAANLIADQVQSFQRDLPHLVDQANQKLADLQKTLDDNGIKVEITRQGKTALQTLQDNLAQSSGD